MSDLEKAIEGNEKAQAELKALQGKAESVDALKAKLKEAEGFKSKAAKVEALEAKLAKLESEGGTSAAYFKDELRKATEARDVAKKALREAQTGFEAEKKKLETERINERKQHAASAALRQAGASDKLIKYAVKEFGLDEIEIDDKGNAPDLTEKAEEFLDKHGEFKGTPSTGGGFIGGKGASASSDVPKGKDGKPNTSAVVTKMHEALAKL